MTTGRDTSPVGRTDFKPDGRRTTPSVCSTRTSSANTPVALRDLPSVDLLLRSQTAQQLSIEHGHALVSAHARQLVANARDGARAGESVPEMAAFEEALAFGVGQAMASSMKPILNLSGTVVHTNLGRSLLARQAVERVTELMADPTNLEFDLSTGRRGDRDSIVEDLLCQLTGAEAATVVNNNAAAVLLTLFALGRGREAVVSRGELVEIGGAFRMPDVMESAGVRLVEVGTTNRTHLRDYDGAIGEHTALLMKVHTSNYVVKGFTAAVSEAALAPLARAHGLPLVCDLGSGSLIDFSAHGLPREPMPQQMIAAGCDVVTFSGDKLLGGPQAGLIVGREAVIARIRKCPLKRALRMSKLPLVALEATLQLYLRPERVTRDVPTLRLLVRPLQDIRATAAALLPAVADAVAPRFSATLIDTESQFGSGALPEALIPSAGLALTPLGCSRKETGAVLQALADALRALPRPVLGRLDRDRLVLDLRCLEQPQQLVAQLPRLKQALLER
jgi:L-seryl-tRNA(Ser) seleniumtransferase